MHPSDDFEVKLLATRSISPYGLGHKIKRVLWNLTWHCFFRLSPRPLMAWRRFVLRAFGAEIDHTARIYPGARIWAPWNLSVGKMVGVGDGADLYSQGRIRLDDFAVISQEACLCTATHDYRRPEFPLVTAPIVVGRRAWVAARAFVHPGVTIGEQSVVGACAVVISDVAPFTIVAGNPARVIKSLR
jgi:putative colanic acid biosynthesis acetyltransferase WcaF